MRLVIVTAFPNDPTAPRGGVEAVSVNLAEALGKLSELEVHVLTTDASRRSVETASWHGIAVHRLPRLGRRLLTGMLGPTGTQIRAYLRDLKPDVIHAHDVYGLAVKGMPIPRVFTVHGFIHADTRIAGGQAAWLRSLAWRWAETRGWADQPHVISISPYVRERISRVVTGVIHDIENPVAERCFDVVRAERRGTIFSAGLISPRKNTLALVEALGRMIAHGADARLRIAGPVGDEAYAQRVAQRIGALGLADRVTLLGRLPTGDILRELTAAAAFALVSLEENAPMVIEEAMAAGVPVLASNRCGMPYMVRDGQTGFLVDPNDPADIAGRARQLLGDDGLRASMSEVARRVARDCFHPVSVARRTAEVYRRAIDCTVCSRGQSGPN